MDFSGVFAKTGPAALFRAAESGYAGGQTGKNTASPLKSLVLALQINQR